MKRFLSILLALTLTVSMSACRTGTAETTDDGKAATEESGEEAAGEDSGTETEGESEGEATEGETEGSEASGDYKIGIITGTVSQGEEEFQAAQKMIEKFGADKIVTATYPDNFSTETETTIAQVVGLASDEAVKAIVFVQAVPGAIAAIEKVRETRPDMLFVAGVAAEAPREIAAAADVVFLVDEIGMGTTVIKQAKAQGAETFIHYSFPRHLGYETIAARHKLFQETCEAEGIQFVDVTAPDPTGDSGVAGAQQFILDDVPRQIENYGKNTAFFSTNCSMQEPLIRSVLAEGAVYPQQCCPSPYHGYPAALNIDVTGHEGDVQYMLDQISAKVKEGGNEGRMSTWPLPVNMLMVEAGVDYAMKYCEGQITERFDDAQVRDSISKISKSYDATESISLYKDDQGDIENFYMILCDFYTF